MTEAPLPAERHFKNGETIIEQGEPALEAFLIISGNVDIFRGGVKIATLGEGEIFGEAALFKGSDYAADVKATGDVTVQPILPSILDEKIKKCDPMIRALIRMLMTRLRKTSDDLAKRA